MSPAGNPTSERIYAAVKQRVLEGVFRPGERIEAPRLAEALNSSLTPVRAALQRLVGEHLVEARPSEGFHRPPVTEISLKDLYEWNGRIAALAAQLAWSAAPGQALEGPEPAPPAAAAALFSTLARRTGSSACALALAGLNDQLHAVRRLEAQVLGGPRGRNGRPRPPAGRARRRGLPPGAGRLSSPTGSSDAAARRPAAPSCALRPWGSRSSSQLPDPAGEVVRFAFV
ncbi:MAG: GntR family transcriptional regulator [Caulobacteraceae bacterium]|nr:GntR family transcriptional regulator [Caulobacteraceae bacterium]